VIALTTRKVQKQWEDREKDGDAAYRKHIEMKKSEASYEDWMESYRKSHPIGLPLGFSSRDAFHEAVRCAVFGEDGMKPICHRPVKRKLIGALHKETLFGPVNDRSDLRQSGTVSNIFRGRVSVDQLNPMQLRMPTEESDKQAVARIA